MKETQTQKIVNLLQSGSKSIQQIVDSTGIKRPNVRGRLSELKKQGLVKKAFDDKFALVLQQVESA